MSVGFKPSQVHLSTPPLAATMGRAELEYAAALIVRACQALGDAWQPVGLDQIGRVLKDDVSAKREPFASMVYNPFFRPDIHGLVERGYARNVYDGHELTDKGIEALRRWVRA